MTPIDERWAIGELTWWLIIVMFGAFAGASRLLYRWEPQSRRVAQSLGNLMVSVLVTLIVGLALDSTVTDKRLLLSIAGAAGWLGGDIIEPIARMLVRARGLNGSDKRDGNE